MYTKIMFSQKFLDTFLKTKKPEDIMSYVEEKLGIKISSVSTICTINRSFGITYTGTELPGIVVINHNYL